MSNVENIDINKYKLTFSVGACEFKKGLDEAFLKSQSKFNIKGFRKGKVPRNIIERTYGDKVFFEEAFNYILRDAYPKAAEESKLEIVSRPEIDVETASKEDGVVFTAIVYIKPEIELADYKDISVEKPNTRISKCSIESQMKKSLEKHSTINKITDRAIKSGDFANIDFEGFLDDVAFEGGKGDNFDLEIGSNTFIDTFEEQIIGKNINDEFEILVTFPLEYGKPELAGKPAMFKVKINDISEKVLPALTDEFVQDTTEFESLADYKKDIKQKLTSQKKEDKSKEVREKVLDQLVERVKVTLPEPMIELEIDYKINEFINGIKKQGLTLDQYLEYMGQSIENMREAYKIICEKQIKIKLALEKIVELEKIEITKKELNAELDKIATSYQMDREKLDSIFGEKEKENISKDLKTQKALNFLIENSSF